MKILVFAGTTEGRMVVEYLLKGNATVTACVATEYGGVMLSHHEKLNINIGRLDTDAMEPLIGEHDLVIDATHPYADIVTRNIKSACHNVKVKYIRVVRPSVDIENIIEVRNTEEAAKLLISTSGNVLVTTGSKELHKFAVVPNYKERLFPRVLPTIEVLEKCSSLGFGGRNLICMQGPFSYDINVALMKQYNIKYMITKDTGTVGGFKEKIKAAKAVGAKIVLIKRPTDESYSEVAITMEELKIYLKENYGIDSYDSWEELHKYKEENITEGQQNKIYSSRNDGIEQVNQLNFFPLFIDINNKSVLVVGGGKIAARRVNTLLKFGAKVKVVAPVVCEDLKKLQDDNEIEIINREYVSDDINGCGLVVTATDQREINYLVGEDAKGAGAFVSVADCKEESNFYFPAVFEDHGIVGGLVSKGGSNHSLVKETARKIRECLLKEES